MLTGKEERLLEALLPRAEKEGIEIVTVQITGASKAPTIRVFIDTDNGVSFDELASSQAWINDIMDEIDPFPGAYTLEVSSPGIDRPLRTLEHFSRYIGETAVIKTIGRIQDRSSWTGAIVEVSDEGVTVETEGQRITIPLDSMKRAHLKGTIDFNAR